MMHPYPTIRVIRQMKDHLLTTMKYRLLEQKFQVNGFLFLLAKKFCSTCRLVICQVDCFPCIRYFSKNSVIANKLYYVCWTSTTLVSWKISWMQLAFTESNQCHQGLLWRNRRHFIHPQNIVTNNNINIVDKRSPLINIIHIEANHLRILVILIVVYLRNPQNMFQYFQILQHNNIHFKNRPLFSVNLVT